eukprot:TRINITY_DN26888_c0_g1_i4.p1 TRINITY_DN26888_c0_g1~~TRINITY_DN26888_c0_g1_i4.p1  ORF type:complete len:159 (+),score=5.48 TRINITY_DN26888_c0_g1_i4:622-1098(+)
MALFCNGGILIFMIMCFVIPCTGPVVLRSNQQLLCCVCVFALLVAGLLLLGVHMGGLATLLLTIAVHGTMWACIAALLRCSYRFPREKPTRTEPEVAPAATAPLANAPRGSASVPVADPMPLASKSNCKPRGGGALPFPELPPPVSYTHLTLPTKRIV